MQSKEDDLESILQSAFETVVPGAFDETTPISIRRDDTLVATYLKVEENFDTIPWVNTRKALFIEISRLIVTQPELIIKEANRLKDAGFPQEDVISAIKVCLLIAKKEREFGHERTENFLLSSIPEEIDAGMLVTTLEHTKQSIYSISTDISADMTPRYRETHIKSIVICLVKKLPRDVSFSTLSFDYENSNLLKLNLFISPK